MKDTGSMYRIARIDNNRTEGWKVTLPGPVGGKATIYKTFTDIRYQGRNQALMAAQKFRDGLITRRKSASGRYGVSLIRVHSVTGAISSITWVVRVPVGGRSKRKSFNLRDYSYEEAWRLAMEERVKHGGLPSPKDPPPMPEWVREWLASTPAKKSGRTGVYLMSVRQNKKCYPSWVAQFNVAGQRKTRFWFISKYGYEGAWRLATARREQYDGLPSPQDPPPMPEWVREWLAAPTIPAKLSCNNTSGRTGVSLRRAKGSILWKASFWVGGKRKYKYWSIKMYGYEGAWRLATARREQYDGLPSPQDPPPMPEWVRERLSHPINPKKPRKPRKPRVGNISGHAGVRLKWTCRHGKIRSVNWEASISADGQKKKRSWAVLKHGYAGAWRLAEECRAGYDGSASPTEPPPMPEWLKEQLLAQKKHG